MNGFLAGSISGLTITLVAQPFEVIKTRIQENHQYSSVSYKKTLSIRDAFNGIVQKDGVGGLWRGTVPALYRTMPGAAMYMMAVAQSRYLIVVASNRWPDRVPSYLLLPDGHTPNALADFFIGGCCRISVGIALNPFTMIKTRFESRAFGSRVEYHSVMMAAKDVIKSNGIRGLWSGWGAVILRDAPYSSIFLSLYGTLKRMIKPQIPNETIAHSISGLAAGVIACTLTQPFDMARARIHLHPAEYKNTLQTLNRIIYEEGFGALNTGFVPRLARKSVTSMLAWTLFDRLYR